MWPFKTEEKEKVVQKTAGTVITGRFRANMNFTCGDTGSVYVKGMIYNIRDGNKEIIPRIQAWVKQSKITLI